MSLDKAYLAAAVDAGHWLRFGGLFIVSDRLFGRLSHTRCGMHILIMMIMVETVRGSERCPKFERVEGED